MTKPPSENLMDWSKAELIKELERLRAVLREHAVREHDPARSGGDSVGGSPYGRGDSLLDTREAVLLEYNEVILVDTKQDEMPVVALILEGRVNYTTRRAKQMYLFNTDGAAAIIVQLLGLGARAGGDFATQLKADIEQRMDELP
jgi:hypothetical protein